MDRNNRRVLVTHPEIPEEGLKLLKETCELVIVPSLHPTAEEILAHVKGVNAILWCTKNRLNADIVKAAGPGLRVVSTMSAGVDNVDVDFLKKCNIPLGNTPQVLDSAVADIAIALILTTSRRLQEGRRIMENGEWEVGRPQWLLGQDIAGSTIGIVGLGGIGQAIARRLKGFEVERLLYTGHHPKLEAQELNAHFVSFEELLKTSDFVVVACPLTDETRNLFNEDAFKKMKSNAILINVGRGGCIDQNALVNALKTGQIWGAGLDVMVPEPLPKDHELMKLSNCVLIPHCGSATVGTRNAMATLAAKNILLGLEGKPLIAQVR